MARSEWDLVRDMMNGKFTGDAAGRSDTDYLKATNKARIDACIKEDLEDKLYDANEQLGVIYDIRYSGNGRYTVEYSARGFGRGKNDYQVRQSVVHAPAPIVKDAKVEDAQTMSIHHQKFGDITARIVSSVPGGFFYTGYVSNGYKLYRNNGKEFVAVKLHFDKPTYEGQANYFNADSKVGKWTDAWNEFDRIRRRLEPDWQAIMKEVKKLYEQHRGDPNWDEGYARFIGN